MRYVVRWSQIVEHVANVEISLDELVAWALGNTRPRTLAVGRPETPSSAGLRRALEVNPHLRAQLLQQYVEATPDAAHLAATMPPGVPRATAANGDPNAPSSGT